MKQSLCGNQQPVAKINTVLFALLAYFYLSSSADFWRQLRTFAWESRTATVMSSSLEMGPSGNGPRGEVSFQIRGDATGRGFSDHLSQRFDWGDVRAKTAAFVERYAPGSEHLAFISPDGTRASLGRFPRSYSVRFASLGLLFLLAAVGFALRWRSERRPRAGRLAEQPSLET